MARKLSASNSHHVSGDHVSGLTTDHVESCEIGMHRAHLPTTNQQRQRAVTSGFFMDPPLAGAAPEPVVRKAPVSAVKGFRATSAHGQDSSVGPNRNRRMNMTLGAGTHSSRTHVRTKCSLVPGRQMLKISSSRAKRTCVHRLFLT